MFKTFNLLDACTIDIAKNTSFPKTIWEILNHLIYDFKIAEYNIDHLDNQKIADEDKSWSVKGECLRQEDISNSLIEIKRLIAVFENRLEKKETTTEHDLKKRAVLEETALHLSFHLGEISLMRRCLNDYLSHEVAYKQFKKQ